MTKNISIPKMIKDAGKTMTYQISDDKLYLADKPGTFIISLPFQGNDEDQKDLNNLMNRCRSFELRTNLAHNFDSYYGRTFREDFYLAGPTGICYTDNVGKTVTWLTAVDHTCHKVVKINKAKLDIFNNCEVYINGPRDPVLISGEGYQAIILPVHMMPGGHLGVGEEKLFCLHDEIRELLNIR